MFMQFMAGVSNRGTDRMGIGTSLADPDIDYAKMAQAYGMYAEGPISDPAKLGRRLQARGGSREARRAGAGRRRSRSRDSS